MLMNPTYNRRTCRLCGSEVLRDRLKLVPTPPANSFMGTKEEAQALSHYDLTVLQCTTCGHHQLYQVVDPNILFKDYCYVSGTSESFRKHFDTLADEIQRSGARRVVELGSNDGTLLRALKKLNVEAVGVEYAENLVELCKKSGLDVLEGGASVANFQQTKEMLEPGADFWVACNVLAHIDDFGGTLRALHHTGATRGVFEVQYLQDLLKSGTFDMVYHEHVDYWRVRELVDWLPLQTGWQVTKVEHIDTHGGSLRVWVSSGSRFEGVGMSGLFLEDEVRDTTRSFNKLKEKITTCRDELESLVFSRYKNVVAYGAPAKFTTLTYELGLNERIKYVIDDSPLKQGKFTPGSGIPVVSLEASLKGFPNTGWPDAIVVTAWNFAEQIVAKLKKTFSPCPPIFVPFPSVKEY